ncbi:MAG: hypothetical protein Q8K35_00980 [Thiobacillus sp.]|nr:hypothetical protein [Thiobacillus sp.]MDP2056316.1 hypothetical protein [Thiobacillus sp.]
MKSNLIKKTLGVLTLGALGLMATGAQADWDRGGYGHGQSGHAYQQSQMFSQQINARQDRQMERIQAGKREGSLRRAEFRELMHEQREIRAMERYFSADGVIDAREFKRLDHALDIASHNIKVEKQDDRQARNAYDPNRRFN